MKKIIIPALLASLLAMGGCATSEKVQPVQLGDHDLSCPQIQEEMTKLDESQVKVEGNKGVNGTNVAAAVAWLPGLVYTYYDASKATDAISARRSHLTEMFENKGCKLRKAEASVTPVPGTEPVQTKDQANANNHAKQHAKAAQTKE
jgi:hypothetical protein